MTRDRDEMTTPAASSPVISNIVQAVRAYIHFNDIAEGHNDHQVVAWAIFSDGLTVVPLIVSLDDSKTIVQASSISSNYVILSPYSQCQMCVRPSL